jgi:hypothetical protein
LFGDDPLSALIAWGTSLMLVRSHPAIKDGYLSVAAAGIDAIFSN